MASNGPEGLSSAFKIDPLMSDGSNYQPWKVKLLDILTSLDYKDHLIQSGPNLKENATEAEKAAKADWDKKDQQALSHIRLRVADPVLVYISGAELAKSA